MRIRIILQVVIDIFIEVGSIFPLLLLADDIELFVYKALFILLVLFPLSLVITTLNLIIFGNQSIGMKITGLIYVDINHKKATRKQVIKASLLYPGWIRNNFIKYIDGPENKDFEIHHLGIQIILKKDCKDD